MEHSYQHAQDDEDRKALADLAKHGIRIPPQPKVLTEFRTLLEAGNYDIKSLARIIGKDPGLSAAIFRAARSPTFSRARKLESLDQVLMVIGVKQTLSLIQAASLASAISDGKRGRSLEHFWTRASEVAQLAAMIAEDNVTVCNVFPEQAYMAGMFHECGVPLLMMRFPKYAEALHLDDVKSWPNVSDEDEKFKVDHCSIGYLVARHWGLPEFVCHAIRFHHDVPDDDFGATITLISILQLAIHIYQRMNNQPDESWAAIGPRVLEEIGIPKEEAEDYYEEICRRFIEAEGEKTWETETNRGF